MKTILVVLFSIFSFTAAQEFVAGKTIVKRYGRALTVEPADVCAKTNGMTTFCGNTDPCAAGTVFTCIEGKMVESAPTACPDDKKYCIGELGSQFCSATPDQSCIVAPMLCKTPGYFPEPLNCSRFHYCYLDGTTLKSEVRECQPGAPFNLAGPQDRKCQVGGACVTQSCTANLAQEWRGFRYNGSAPNQVALKCIGGKVDHIHQCAKGLTLDETFLAYSKCFMYCTMNASDNYRKAVYPTDNTKYNQCLLGKSSVESCEFGQIFNPNTLVCEKAAATTTPASIQ